MTQFFTYRGFSLRRATHATKVLISGFLFTVAVALAVGIVNYRVRTGLHPSRAAEWYRGSVDESAALYEKTPLELLDATHPHLFGQAFLFFVLCHLFALTPVRPRFKLAIYGAAYLTVLLDAASPWLIRYAAPSFGWLQVANTTLMTLVFALLVLVPLKEMWLTPRGRPEPREVEV